ncbi:hypothetical protein [Riemerella anatipestifer]|uniref:Uncharacterized protein n=1 Tax=Riemerella anatipestifer TaxID=34085 RepID=A0A1S7DV45_RIEAN|nr:hypothetical protein [Riemerella anatipestifer]AQY23002.1 hypothetical protein AB406_2062 [Riemerella anatipestifer]MBT0556820.1 hypothetical protein [Riemerella anatipestifer]MCO7355744.1 hypothetical protein [Riemerella anatipestifer]MDY3317725.1 hypothetical protein [Riemerella anatipestifer]MDY3525074.1 hypothetical protein [Riemerella anatipestifer]
MATIRVEIDLDDFSTYDLLNELEFRLECGTDTHEIKKGLQKILRAEYQAPFNPKNIIEESKIKFFIENFDCISEEDLKSIIDNKHKK